MIPVGCPFFLDTDKCIGECGITVMPLKKYGWVNNGWVIDILCAWLIGSVISSLCAWEGG